MFNRSLRYICGTALVLFAAAKLYALTGGSPLNSLHDPLLTFLPKWMLTASAMLLELSIAALCFVSNREKLVGASLLWLVGVFSAYKMGLAAIGYKGPCSCLGLADANVWTESQEKLFTNWILVLLFLTAGKLLLSKKQLMPRIPQSPVCETLAQ